MTDHELFRTRIALVQCFLQKHDYDAILLNRADNFAMATGGKRNFVPRFTDMGAAGLLVTRKGATHFIGNNIETTRLRDEELADWVDSYETFPWHDGDPAEALKRTTSGTVVSDDGSVGKNVNGDLALLRALLTPREFDKYRELGRRAAEAMTAAAQQVSRGMLEADVAASLHAEAARRHLGLSVCLIAADDRIARYRHPLPTVPPLLGGPAHAVNRYVMIVGGFVSEGLVVSMTRFVAVEEMDPAVIDAMNRIASVDTILAMETRPGRNLGDLFNVACEAYPRCGFGPEEWQNHHQGGPTGYAGRTSKATPGHAFPCLDEHYTRALAELLGEDISMGVAYAWNPSAPGVKSEDTMLLHPDGTIEVVTETPAFPCALLDDIDGVPTGFRKALPLQV
jgi:Xaa-Pro aminopeptidase